VVVIQKIILMQSCDMTHVSCDMTHVSCNMTHVSYLDAINLCDARCHMSLMTHESCLMFLMTHESCLMSLYDT
jgi:hypothetical protein